MGVLARGQQAAPVKLLAFSRALEATADQAGASYLSKAGITGKGMLDFFSKLQIKQDRRDEETNARKSWGQCFVEAVADTNATSWLIDTEAY